MWKFPTLKPNPNAAIHSMRNDGDYTNVRVSMQVAIYHRANIKAFHPQLHVPNYSSPARILFQKE